MKLLKKDHVKSVMVLCMITTIAMMVIVGVVSYKQHRQYCYEYNQSVAGIIGSLIQAHPELEDEIMVNLKEGEEYNSQLGSQILSQYGYDAYQQANFSTLEEKMQKNIVFNSILIGILGIIFFLIFLVYIFIKDQKLEEITTYLKKVQNKEYSLKIEENTEGELSNLRNEIYKITVMLRQQAEDLRKDKTYLADSISDISHQLKTPLTSISVMIDILKENKEVPEEKKKEFLFEISRQLDWINWLVISLLKLSKLDAGTADFKKEEIEIGSIIENAVQNLSIPIEIRRQEVQINAKNNAKMIGDYHWTLEALTNILKNCIEHSKEGGKIEICYEENALFTQIIIRDEGSGIAKEDLPYIFKRFYKGKNSSKDSIGIGLALAKSILENEEGDIQVISEIGIGTTFIIKIYKGVY